MAFLNPYDSPAAQTQRYQWVHFFFRQKTGDGEMGEGSTYQVDDGLFAIDKELREKMSLETISLHKSSMNYHLICKCVHSLKKKKTKKKNDQSLTWLLVLLITGFGLYLR